LRFVDTNVFLYHMANDPRYGDQANKIIQRIEEGEGASTSTLVIGQACSYLKWKKRADAIPTFLAFLRSLPNLTKVETTFLHFAQAEEFCAKHGIAWRSWDDAIIAIQMRDLGIGEIYTNDSDFDVMPGIARIF
jgi:predicted nucleic acid-binding protein